MYRQATTALDIETAPATEWITYEEAALDPNRNRVTVIGLCGPGIHSCYGSIDELPPHPPGGYITHVGKFDLKTLIIKRPDMFSSELYTDDTCLMAAALSYRIPEKWLIAYDEKRVILNKALGKQVHRKAGQFSLKCLAPYFLGVDPFWEVDDHSDLEYNKKDTLYTLQLSELLTSELKKEDGLKFYSDHLMPWARMILDAEVQGIAINLPLMEEKSIKAEKAKLEAETTLRSLWQVPFQEYRKLQEQEVRQEYSAKKASALAKLKPVVLKTMPDVALLRTAEKIQATAARYDSMMEKALSTVTDLNLSSPTQLSWLLKDHLGLDITTFDEEDESTGKPVLSRLAAEGREDIKTFLDYRRESKLTSSFFPSYREKSFNGKLFCNFNITGARTGRLSSSGPNLQQVPGHLHELFYGGPGYKVVNYDLANIEPLLVAYVTEDMKLCDLMLNNKSFHDNNVRLIFGYDKVDKVEHKRERDACKEFGLSLLYGAYINRMQESFSKRGFSFTEKQCKMFYKAFQEEYSQVFEYKRMLDTQAEQGVLLKNIFGRPIVPGASIKMTVFNTLFQGSANDLLLESCARITKRFKEEKLDASIRLLVHDEVVAVASDAQAERASEICKQELTRWELPTAFGVIRTQCEGGVNDYWAK